MHLVLFLPNYFREREREITREAGEKVKPSVCRKPSLCIGLCVILHFDLRFRVLAVLV